MIKREKTLAIVLSFRNNPEILKERSRHPAPFLEKGEYSVTLSLALWIMVILIIHDIVCAYISYDSIPLGSLVILCILLAVIAVT